MTLATASLNHHSRSARLRRFWRLTRKELREILRDRRTILTLVLMPLLLYPVLSVAFQQLFLASSSGTTARQYVLGFVNEQEWKEFELFLERGLQRLSRELQREKNNTPLPPPQLRVYQLAAHELEEAVRDRSINLGIRMRPRRQTPLDAQQFARDWDVFYLETSETDREALEYIRSRIAVSNAVFLADRLRESGVVQRSDPMRLVPEGVRDLDAKRPFSLAALIPLILILMTITGAVYPAIDLTAGERERGTLEVLVAAPLPRFSLLAAKYVAVLTVALLTALVNLTMMTVTILVSGLGPALFGPAGISAVTVAEVFGLLLLFAAFFSAVLLTLTSFARSFKEAQAYLIPLMLVSLGPGMLGMMPGLKLNGLLAVAPLINIVLLARDLFIGNAQPGLAVVVVASTLLYALTALALAARVFGAEAVLYSSQSGWADLFRRPPMPDPAPSIGSALFCLALSFPSMFFVNYSLALFWPNSIAVRMLGGALALAVVFGAAPLLIAYLGHITTKSAFALVRPSLLSLFGAILLGGGLWPFLYQFVLFLRAHGWTVLQPEHLERGKELLQQWRALSPIVLVATIAIVPAIFEELFFRGFLYSGLRTRLSTSAAVLSSGLLFGSFHLLVTDALAFERFLPSLLLGLVLGAVRAASGSIVPGMILHACHNSISVIIAIQGSAQPLSKVAGESSSSIPTIWFLYAFVATVFGGLLIYLGRRRKGGEPVETVETEQPVDQDLSVGDESA